MKRMLLCSFLMGLILLLVSPQTFAQCAEISQKANSSAQRIDNFVIIGAETTLNSNVPVYPYYGYSISQTLYLQTELNFSNKMIEGIGYQYNGNQSVLELWIEIYFEHTTLDNLTNTVSLNNATKVFDDVYYFKEGEEWSTVDIDPFYYNNNDNLLVTVIEKKPGWDSYSDKFYTTSVPVSYRWCQGTQNDGSPYNPEDLPLLNQITYRPNTKFLFDDMPTGPPLSIITPTSLDFGNVETSNSKALPVVIKNGGGDPLEITGFSSSNSQFAVIDASFPIVLGPGEKKKVQIAFTPTMTGNISGTIEFMMDKEIEGDHIVNVTGKGLFFRYVVIGDGEEVSNTPVYPWYGYSFTQTLYLQSDIDTDNAMIQRVGYQYAGTNPSLELTIEIWMTHTDLTSITSTIPMTGFTKVYDGPYNLVAGEEFAWVEITPFLYNNVDNLIIAVFEKKPGYNSSSDKFYSTKLADGQNMCVGSWNDSNPYDPYNLPAGNQINYRPNTKLYISGEIPTEPEIKTQPLSLNFGEVEATVTKVLNIEVMNIGGGTLEITGANFTNLHYSVINVDFPVLLEMGQKKVFDIQFAPTDPGLEEGLLTFEIDASIPGSKVVELSGRGLRFGVLRESFEKTLFPPLGWLVVDNNVDNKGWLRNVNNVPTGKIAPRTGIAAAGLSTYAGSPGQISYDDWLITPKMKWQNGDIFNFWIKRLADQNNQIWRIKLSSNSTELSDFTQIDVITDPPLNYVLKEYDLSNFGLQDGDEYYIAFHFNGKWCWPGVIDDVLGSVMIKFNYDLLTLNFTGPNLLYKNTPQNFTVEFGNWGFYDFAGDDYSIALCTEINGIENTLASLPGVDIAVGETKTVTIPLNIANIGVYDVYAKLIAETDEDQSNNKTKSIDIEVIPTSFVVKNIGTFPMPENTWYYYLYPINFEDYRKSSLTQTLYFKNELNTGGIIDRICYYRSFATDMLEKKIKVWIKEVDATSLSAETYVPPSQMTLVFDGMVDFPAGMGRSDIILSNPYVYSGSGNLLVTVYYYWGTNFNSTSRFANMNPDYGPERTLFDADYRPIDPENPSTTFLYSTANYPYTTLMFETGNGLGNISGRVLYQVNNSSVQGAKVTIENPLFPGLAATIYTNASGNFSAPYALAGNNLKITISKYGYVDLVLENVVLPPNGTKNLGNIYLIESPKVDLDGNVVTSDDMAPAVGAIVKLIGMDNYQTTTDENGHFSFSSIWGLASYQIEITLDEYQDYQSVIQVPGVNHTLDQITLLEIAPGPNIVTLDEEDDKVILSWYGANDPYPIEFRYDDGEAVGVLITTGNPTIVGGSSWMHNAVINQLHWYTYQTESYPASDYVMLTVLGLTPQGEPDPNDVLFIQGNVRNNYGWNSFDLPYPINAPNGFFFGTSGYNNYTLIAYDDGVDEPWVWEPRTQWSNGMGAYNPLENVTSPALYGNIFIRASGLTYGALETDLLVNSNIRVIDLSSITTQFLTMNINPIETGNPKIKIMNYKPENSRGFEHYNVYRKLASEKSWKKLNHAPIHETSYTDFSWEAAKLGTYIYAVDAEYTNGVLSDKSESDEIEKKIINGQIVELPKGWSAISSYKDIENPSLEYLFRHITPSKSMIILLGKSGFYWPGQNINQLVNWNTHEGYKIKMSNDEAILMKGDIVTNKTVPLTKGVNYLPVLSEISIDADVIFNQIFDKLIFAFDFSEGLIYWPEGGIMTLATLDPGKGYLLIMSAECEVLFPDGTKKANRINKPSVVNNSPWKVINTGSAHIIAIENQALKTMSPGDIIGVFNSFDVCVGQVQYHGNNDNESLIVYGNDFTTPDIDGLMEGELMKFKYYSATDGQISEPQVTWDYSMPDADIYTEYGRSAITGIKLGATSIAELTQPDVIIYPNPASRQVFINVSNNGDAKIELMNQLGKSLLTTKTKAPTTRIDISSFASGIYFIKVTCNNFVITQKLIIR